MSAPTPEQIAAERLYNIWPFSGDHEQLFEALVALLKGAYEEQVVLAEKFAEIRTRAEKAERELAEAVEAVRPFAELGASYSTQWEDDDSVETHYSTESGRLYTVTAGHCRRATSSQAPSNPHPLTMHGQLVHTAQRMKGKL